VYEDRVWKLIESQARLIMTTGRLSAAGEGARA